MLVKWFYISAGWFFVALAAIGVALPGLPTTPFLLLAAGCFAKSSPRFYNWLLGNRLFGPLISNWQETRSLSRKTKYFAIGSTLLMGSASALFLIEAAYLQGLILALVLMGVYFVARIPVTESLLPQAVEE